MHGNQLKTLQVWEIGSGMQLAVAQISIYSSPSSTTAFEVEMEGRERSTMLVPPGNTITFTDRNIRSITITLPEDNAAYIEGKYAVSSSFEVQPPRAEPHEDNK